MFDFNIFKILFDEYIDECYLKIRNKYLISTNEVCLKEVNLHKDMIKQKYSHTMRVVENISKLADKMGMNINFAMIAKLIGLLHDVGRFEQAIYHDSFVDSIVYKDNPLIKNHAEEGEAYLNRKGFKKFLIPEIYQPAIAKSVGLHQINQLPQNFNFKVDKKLVEINPGEILTGTYNFNKMEEKIISLLLQMIRDVDKIDILYQRAIGEIKPIPSYLQIKNSGLKNIEDIWGIKFSHLKELNSLNEINNAEHLKILTKQIPLEKLSVSDEIKKLIYAGKNISLRELQSREDYSFITAIWWSIYTFLSDINFVSNLEVIKEDELLMQIYSKYPEEYKPLIDEIFKYAEEKLIEERLEISNGNLYLSKRKS